MGWDWRTIKKVVDNCGGALKVEAKYGAPSISNSQGEEPSKSKAEIGDVQKNRAKARIEKEKGVQAYNLFGRYRKIQVADKLNLLQPEVEKYYLQYLRLESLDALNNIYRKYGESGLESVWELWTEMDSNGMNPSEFVYHLKMTPEFRDLRSAKEREARELKNLKDQKAIIEYGLEATRQDIKAANRKIKDLSDEEKAAESVLETVQQELNGLNQRKRSLEASIQELSAKWNQKLDRLFENKVIEIFGHQDDRKYIYRIIRATVAVLKDEKKYNIIRNLDFNDFTRATFDQRYFAIASEILRELRGIITLEAKGDPKLAEEINRFLGDERWRLKDSN